LIDHEPSAISHRPFLNRTVSPDVWISHPSGIVPSAMLESVERTIKGARYVRATGLCSLQTLSIGNRAVTTGATVSDDPQKT
jgi:hypothetical protein